MPHPVRSLAASLASSPSRSRRSPPSARRWSYAGTNLKLYNLIGTLRVEAARRSCLRGDFRQGADGIA